MEHEISVKKEAEEASSAASTQSQLDLSDCEVKLEIDEHTPVKKHQQQRSNEAVESLLLLGTRPVLSGPEIRQRASSVTAVTSMLASMDRGQIGRRYSSGSEARSDPGTRFLNEDNNRGGAVSYYQRMRERNNEASKRCRLKRRMKAESLENQATHLISANRLLRSRISRLEKISATLKEGVKNIQAGSCTCDLTVAVIRQNAKSASSELDQTGMELSSAEIVNQSVQTRADCGGLVESASGGTHHNTNATSSCSSEDDLTMSSTTCTPPPPQLHRAQSYPATTSLSLPGRTELSVTPVLSAALTCPKQSVPVSSSAGNFKLILPKSAGSVSRHVTALDMLNDTIVKSLDSGNGQSQDSCTSPLNLVKTSKQQSTFFLGQQNCSNRNSVESVGNDYIETSDKTQVVQIVQCDSPAAARNNGGHPSRCIAEGTYNLHCRTDLLDLNKLTCYLDLVTRKVVKVDGTSAMERAIIKSRLNIAFWKANEIPAHICGAHRHAIVHDVDFSSCAMCTKRRSKKLHSPQSHMYTITYRMSLEYYTITGRILPIGLLVCAHCKDKQLKAVDVSSSQFVHQSGSPEPAELQYSQQQPDSNNMGLKREASSPLQCVNRSKSPKLKPIIQTSLNDVQVLVHPVQRQVLQVQPNSSAMISPLPPQHNMQPSNNGAGRGNNIFTKIGQLNEALHSINPLYKPIGFSITSIESCSPSVLQDAVLATETAVSTLMSVIAPGQEAYLWEAIKPKMDAKLGKVKQKSQQNNKNNNSGSEAGNTITVVNPCK